MIRLYGFPYSTNMERIQLALGHKELKAEYLPVPYDDRSEVRAASLTAHAPRNGLPTVVGKTLGHLLEERVRRVLGCSFNAHFSSPFCCGRGEG